MSVEDKLYPLLRYYEKAPAFLRNTAGALYRTLPARWRYGPRYAEFKFLARAMEDADIDRIRAVQFEQLKLIVTEAAAQCPWYARTFAEAGFDPARMDDPEAFAACPLIEKQTLQEQLPEMVSRRFSKRQRIYITTGGSTGVPVGFYLHKGVSRPKEQAFLETMWERAGWHERARVAVIRGHVTSPSSKGTIAYHDATRGWLMLSSYHLTDERMPEYLEALEEYNPEFIHAYPSAALQIAEYLTRTGQSWRLPVRALLCGSEQLTLPQKGMLETVFQCRAYRWYGHSERVVLAGEGRNSELLYFFPTYGYVEFGPPDKDGLQEIIGTSFHNLVMPLIRYRTGDYVRLAESSAQREYPWPAARAVAGRDQEYLISAGGRKISLTAFNMHDAVFDGLYAVQFYQNTPGRAEFRYIAGPSFDRARLKKIEHRIREKLGDDFDVILKAVDTVEKTERGKHKWLVSRLSS